MAPVIVAKDLYKCYPGFSPVLRGVNIEVEPGESVAIMGPSGCGKSTMLHILGMLHAPDSGSLEILNTDILTLDREQTAAFRRGNMGFVMQSNNLFEHSTVFENVEFPLIYDNVPPQERWARVIRALDLVRLSARVHYRSNRLSGGEQQRVAIARAMVNNPKILLADEPTGALDAQTSRLIMENFRNLCHSGGVAMVMVTHDPKMAEYCDSIYTLEDGILHRKKHNVLPWSPDGKASLLDPVIPLVRSALVAKRFPEPLNPDLMELARRLHQLRLLSRIYALNKSGALGNPEGYALPLPVRQIGYWQRLGAIFSLFSHARASHSLWQIWRKVPAANGFFGKCKTFACGALMSRWGLADETQFLYAAGARRPATAAWIAARLLHIPFAFMVKARDLAHFKPEWRQKAKDAAFVVCPTQAIKNEFCRLVPEAARVVLVRNPLIAAPAEDEPEGGLPSPPDRPLEILAMGSWTSSQGFAVFLDACQILKKNNLKFKISILGRKTFADGWQCRKRGLGKITQFQGRPDAESMRVIFKNADLFALWPASGKGLELDLPWYVCEAMAFGLPIAALTLTPGLAEGLTDKSTCLVAQAPDAAAFARILQNLMTDKNLAASLAENARRESRQLIDVEAGSKILADLIAQGAGAAEGSS